MKKLIYLAVCVALLATPGFVKAQEVVIDFEELNDFDSSLPEVFGFQLLGAGDVFNGYASGASTGEFRSQGASFETREFGPGFSYSRYVNTTTPGFSNLFAAFPGGGSGGNGTAISGETYGMVATGASTTSLGESTSSATLVFDGLADLDSIDVANSTYSTLYFRDGLDGFAPEPDLTQQFSEDDFLMLEIAGFDSNGVATGTAEVDLARFENGSLQYLEQWETVDLSDFDDTKSLAFSLSSSDFDPDFGLNVPAFLAIDNLRFVAVPEPSAGFLLAIGVAFTAVRRRRVVISAGSAVAR